MNANDYLIEQINQIDPELFTIEKSDDKGSVLTFWSNVFLKKVADAMTQFWYNWSQKYREKATEEELCAQCFLQMIITKIKSVQKLGEGIDLLISESNHKIYDPSIMAIIQRSIYEMTTLFYYLFVVPDNIEERRILYLLWRIKGLYNKLNISNVPDIHKSAQEQVKKEISIYIKSIEDNVAKINITTKAKDKLFKIVKHESFSACGFEFIKDATGKIKDIEKIKYGDEKRDDVILGKNGFPLYYRYLSSFVHPSYIGVEQFGTMFNNGISNDSEQYEFSMCAILGSKFVSYFCKSIKGGKESFNTLTDKQKQILKLGDMNLRS